jgi:hypothetical protein
VSREGIEVCEGRCGTGKNVHGTRDRGREFEIKKEVWLCSDRCVKNCGDKAKLTHETMYPVVIEDTLNSEPRAFECLTVETIYE